MTLVGVLLSGDIATAQTRSVSIPLTTSSVGGWDGCGGFTADSAPNGVKVTLGRYVDADWIPPGSTVQKASVSWRIGNGKKYTWQQVPDVTLNLDGIPLGSKTTVSNYALCMPSATMTYVFPTGTYTAGLPGYVYGAPHKVEMFLEKGWVITPELAILTVTYSLPADPISFNITDAAPERDRRILLSNLRTGYPYPLYQSLGGEDKAVPMFLAARGADGVYRSGVRLYLRVIDPPDTAAYMSVNGMTPPAPGDNAECDAQGRVASLEGSGLVETSSGSGAWEATTGANGVVHFKLRIPEGAAAGDNYRVEASTSPSFPADTSYRSGMLTAWKRVFVEKRNMLRNGMRITKRAEAGASQIQVRGNRYAGNSRKRLQSGQTIVLVHAPQTTRSDQADGWYVAYRTIADVTPASEPDEYIITLGTKQGKTVSLTPLLKPFGPDLIEPQIGDAIAYIDRDQLTNADYFEADHTLLALYDASGKPMSAFPEAFTEYQVLTTSSLPSGFVPLPWIRTLDQNVLRAMSAKWSESAEWDGHSLRPLPNHQFLAIGDDDGLSPTQNAGITTFIDGGKLMSIVFRGGIEALTGTSTYSKQNPEKWAAKTVAHELAHQWTSNEPWKNHPGVSLRHCPPDSAVHDDASTVCLLASPSSTANEQKSNMAAKFHQREVKPGVWHSEYSEIRTLADPFVP